MSGDGKIAMVTGAGSGIGRATALALLADGLLGRAGRPPPRGPGADRRRGGTGRRAGAGRPRRRERPRLGARPLRRDEGSVRPPRPAVQQRRHRRPARPAGRPDVRAVAAGRRRQPDRRVPLHAGGVPADEGPGPARRPDHQQRLDLGARAPAELRPLHGHQARDHRPDQVDGPRRPEVRHRLRADRHRQRRDRDDGPDEAGRAPGERRDGRRADDGRGATWPAPCSTWRACPSTRTSSS